MKKILFLALGLCLILYFLVFNKAHTKVIDQALRIELSVCSKESSPCEVEGILRTASDQIRKADYQEALAIIMKGLEKYPDNFELQSDFAAILGDYSESLSGSIQEQMVQKSKQAFEKLLPEVELQPKSEQFSFKNEYCYRFKLHRQQYENGQACINYYLNSQNIQNTPEWQKQVSRGYYYQGVGAVYYAQQLLLNGDKQSACEWAQQALVAWAQYFTYKNDYYNSYVHYALALGILGYRDEMMRALQKSADIIHKDLNYLEFKEVTDFIEEISHK